MNITDTVSGKIMEQFLFFTCPAFISTLLRMFAFCIVTAYSLKSKHHVIGHRFLRLWSKSPVMPSCLVISGLARARSLSTSQSRHYSPQPGTSALVPAAPARALASKCCNVFRRGSNRVHTMLSLGLYEETQTDASSLRWTVARIYCVNNTRFIYILHVSYL